MHLTSEVTPSVIRLCRGAKSCPHAVIPQDITQDLERIVLASGWPQFLQSRHQTLRHHHQFRLAVASCPNGCTQPHIADFALIAHARMHVSPELCLNCGECLNRCAEKAVRLDPLAIDDSSCLGCTACATCPANAITIGHKAYRILIGGKLGRHPRLAHELGIFDLADALKILDRTLALYMNQYRPGMRLGDLILELGQNTFDHKVLP